MERLSEQIRRVDPRETATDLYCITMLFLFPLFPGFSGYADITYSKLVFFVAATGLWPLALAFLTLRGRLPLPRPGAAQWAALALLAVALLSALCSPFFPGTLIGLGRYDGLLSTALYCLIFLGVSAFTRAKPLFARAFAAAAALCCVVAVLQLRGGNPLRLFPGDLRYADSGVRYSGAYLGTVGNTNLLDAVLCMAVPLCVCAFFEKKRPLYLLPLALSLAVLAAAGGSGAWVALGAFVLAALLLLPRTRTARICCALIAVLLPVAGLLVLWFRLGTSGTLWELSELLHGRVSDSFGSSRIRIWRACLALVPARPLLGGGPGTIAARLDIEFSRYVPETGATLRSFVDNAHSVYLGALVNTGALGLLATLALLTLCFVRALCRRGREPLSAAFALAAFCGAVHAFFGLGLCLTEPIFYVLLGLCACRDKPSPPMEVSTCEPDDDSISSPQPRS
jgi:O-antigen ligase